MRFLKKKIRFPIMSGLEVVIKNSKNHPKCPHGPALLFSRLVDGVRRNFFACSACRDRKLCPFFLYEDEKNRKQPFWDEQNKKFVKNVNHRKLFLVLSEVSLFFFFVDVALALF